MARQNNNDSHHYDTIIIGAGMSGLACAARLLQDVSYEKTKKLLVLEARDRIGGRIGFVRVNGNRLDTGANWIHGVGTEQHPNPLVQYVLDGHFKELNSSVTFRPRASQETTGPPTITETQTDNDWVRVDSSRASKATNKPKGDLVIPAKDASEIFASLWGLIWSLHETAVETSADEARQTSMIQTVMNNNDFQKAFQGLSKEYHDTLKALPQFLEGMEAAPLCAQSAEHTADHPGMGLLEYALDDFDGKQVFLRDGYISVIERVGKQVIEQGHVKLDTAVQQIQWDTDPIVVSTSNGKFTAKKVVCTIPLGVLKHHVSSSNKETRPLFSPALPTDKTEAILSLGFGTLDKIFLVYSQPWWKNDPYWSIIKKGISSHSMSEGPPSPPPSEPDSFWGFTSELAGLSISPTEIESGPRTLSLMNLHALTGFPVLSAFVSCANALHIESLSDHAAGALVHRALTEWLGGVAPPTPDAVHVTRWAQDEFSRGSYTHMITGLSETKHREAFQKPLLREKTELRFAGEHTSFNHFATVHGALISGWREADAILQS